MYRRRRRASSACAEDELALVKAAAWAWYQHGSGNEGSRPTREFDLARPSSRAPCRPSRYKIEALRATRELDNQFLETKPCSSATSPARSESSLLDFYEVERITRELDLLTASNQSRSRRRGASSLRRAVTKTIGGFWARQAMGICGAMGDAVEAQVVRGARGMPHSASWEAPVPCTQQREVQRSGRRNAIIGTRQVCTCNK